MRESANIPAKWLKYLLYVGIASMANYLLVSVLPNSLNRLFDYIFIAAALFLMFRLTPANGRYHKAILFTGVSLIISALNLKIVALAGSLCAILGQYQEYIAHGELLADRDPRLAGKWGSLFWFQFAVEVVSAAAITFVAMAMRSGGNAADTPISSMITVASAFVTVILKVVYLLYLKRSIKVLETEIVVE